MTRAVQLIPAAVALAALIAVGAGAAEAPQAEIAFTDGTVSPATLTLTVGKTVTIVVKNTGKTPVEFESHALHKEKIIPAGGEITLVLDAPTPGRYDFYDDFHPGAGKGVIEVK